MGRRFHLAGLLCIGMAAGCHVAGVERGTRGGQAAIPTTRGNAISRPTTAPAPAAFLKWPSRDSVAAGPDFPSWEENAAMRLVRSRWDGASPASLGAPDDDAAIRHVFKELFKNAEDDDWEIGEIRWLSRDEVMVDVTAGKTGTSRTWYVVRRYPPDGWFIAIDYVVFVV